MTAVRRLLAASLLASATLWVVGCAPSAPAPSPGGGDTGQPAPTTGGETSQEPGGGSGGGGACPTVPQEGFELFSSEAVTKAPAEGQVFGGWQSYPCGSMVLESGSGPSATYSCTATFTIEPPAAWKGGSGEFKYWFPMPASVYRSKVVTANKTVHGTGGNWDVARKPA